MKNKFLLVFVALLLIVLISILIIYFDESPWHIVGFISAGLSTALIFYFLRSLLVPPYWYFKNRHMIEGGIVFLFLMIFLGFNDNSFSILSILFRAIYGFLFGFFVLGYLQKLNFNSLARRIVLDPELIKNKILTDKADFILKNEKTSGILVLTKEKLSFIPEKKDFENLEIDLTKIKPIVSLRKKWFFNSGIAVNDMNFLLSYPRLWVRNINESNNI